MKIERLSPCKNYFIYFILFIYLICFTYLFHFKKLITFGVQYSVHVCIHVRSACCLLKYCKLFIWYLVDNHQMRYLNLSHVFGSTKIQKFSISSWIWMNILGQILESIICQILFFVLFIIEWWHILYLSGYIPYTGSVNKMIYGFKI